MCNKKNVMSHLILNNIGGPGILIFVGALISAVGAIWAMKQQASFERQLRLKSDEIATLSQQIAHSVTGGESYCYLAFSLPDSNSTNSLMTVVHQGKFPLYDVSIRLVDLAAFDTNMKGKTQISIDDFQKTNQIFSIGNLPSGQAMTIGKWQLPQSGKARYNIFISARNGFITELVRIELVSGKWVAAYKVEAGSGRKHGVLYEKIHPDFPRNEKGEVLW